MSRLISHLVACSVVFAIAIASPAYGQNAKQQQRAAKRAAENVLFQFPKEITLTEEQQAKLKAIKDEYSPKLAAISTKQNEILTEEQRTARTEVGKANREAKKTGKEAQAAIETALKLTDEQKTKWTATQKEMQELRKVVEQKKAELLTEEQKAKLPKRGANT